MLEISGSIFTILVGTLFHFAYELIGRWPPLAFLFPINESIWEHFKMVFWPFVIWGVIEALILNSRIANIIVSKTLGIYTSIITIIILHYAYKGLIGKYMVVADILIFIISILVGFFVSYRILIKRYIMKSFKSFAYLLLLALTLMIVYFTYYPPSHFLFIPS